MRRSYASYTVLYVFYPERPDVERFVAPGKATIYINLSARPDANVIMLIFR